MISSFCDFIALILTSSSPEENAHCSVLSFSAHTKDSAKALVDTIHMAFPEARLALVVAMANDKDHLAFAREFLSGIFCSYLAFALKILPLVVVSAFKIVINDNTRKKKFHFIARVFNNASRE